MNQVPSHHHSLVFAGLSLIVAVLGSWTALDLFRRVRSHVGSARRVWLSAAAVAMGLSIWSMHFIAMLGFDPGSPVSYDPGLTLLSLALAIGATLGAFLSAAGDGARRSRILAAGVAMGGGICLMHYVGMAALRSAVSLGYQPRYVVASLVVAVIAATAALFAAKRERSFGWRLLAAITLGFAIVGMHYTAMLGLELTRLPGAPASPGAPPLALGAAVTAGSLLILFLALLASLYDERLNVFGALEAGRIGYWELGLSDFSLQVSARAKEIMGREPEDVFTYADLTASIDPEERAHRDELLAEALRRHGEYDAEYRIHTPAGQERWINIRGRVTGLRSSRARRMVGVVLDVTDRRRAFLALADAERRQRVLIDELNHRVKNTLATVQSLARQTGKGSASIEAFRAALDARLVALSQTHNALTRGGWETAALRELLEQELSPYSADQVRLSGPDVALTPRQTLALGMIFHELATNAAKYGALSAPAGVVQVAWASEAGRLSISWRESGGPAVTAPSRSGFGSRLISGSVESELGGVIERSFEPDGFAARITMPL